MFPTTAMHNLHLGILKKNRCSMHVISLEQHAPDLSAPCNNSDHQSYHSQAVTEVEVDNILSWALASTTRSLLPTNLPNEDLEALLCLALHFPSLVEYQAVRGIHFLFVITSPSIPFFPTFISFYILLKCQYPSFPDLG
jgi:hypothetical protein